MLNDQHRKYILRLFFWDFLKVCQHLPEIIIFYFQTSKVLNFLLMKKTYNFKIIFTEVAFKYTDEKRLQYYYYLESSLQDNQRLRAIRENNLEFLLKVIGRDLKYSKTTSEKQQYFYFRGVSVLPHELLLGPAFLVF